jgi:hypothetical protein
MVINLVPGASGSDAKAEEEAVKAQRAAARRVTIFFIPKDKKNCGIKKEAGPKDRPLGDWESKVSCCNP